MLSFIKKMFGSKPVETVAEVPYKVETPAAVEPVVNAVTPVAEQAVEAVVKSIAPVKKPAPKKQQFAKKPAAPKTAQPKTQTKPKTPPKPKAKPAV